MWHNKDVWRNFKCKGTCFLFIRKYIEQLILWCLHWLASAIARWIMAEIAPKATKIGLSRSLTGKRKTSIFGILGPGLSPARRPVVPGPPFEIGASRFTFGLPVATYIQYCILKMCPPLLLNPGDEPAKVTVFLPLRQVLRLAEFWREVWRNAWDVSKHPFNLMSGKWKTMAVKLRKIMSSYHCAKLSKITFYCRVYEEYFLQKQKRWSRLHWTNLKMLVFFHN